jgi:hypothetical protein
MSLQIELPDVMKGVGASEVGAAGIYPEGLDESVLKALSSFQSTANDAGAFGDLHPLIGQSLDPVIYAITERAPYHTPLLNKLRSQSAKSLLEEYDRLKSLGDAGSWFNEGGLPREATSQYERVLARIKFMGQTGIVTGPMQAAAMHTFGSAKAREMFARTQRLLLDTEDSLWFGNSELHSYAFDGFFQQMFRYGAVTDTTQRNRLLIDLRGVPFDVGYLDEAITSVWDESHGDVDTIWTSPQDKRYIDFQQQPYRRVQTGGDTVNVTRNIIATKTHTAFGDVDHYFDKFLRVPRPPRTAAAQAETNYPTAAQSWTTAPNIATATGEALDSTGGYLTVWPYRRGTAANWPAGMVAGLPAGTFYYAVAPINAYGEGIAVATTAQASATVTEGEQVEITLTPVDHTSTFPITGDAKSIPTAWALYRGTTSVVADMKRVAIFPRLGAAGALGLYDDTAQVLHDDGTWIPGTTMAAVQRSEVLSLRYLLKPVTYDLAKIDDRERWMHIQYLSPIVHAPTHQRVFYNIGAPPPVGSV